jgi:hypothetical protein
MPENRDASSWAPLKTCSRESFELCQGRVDIPLLLKQPESDNTACQVLVIDLLRWDRKHACTGTKYKIEHLLDWYAKSYFFNQRFKNT